MNNSKIVKIFQENNYLYEEVVAIMCKQFANKGIFIDCGAHTGQHCENMLLNENCKDLIAVEAIAELVTIINQKINASPTKKKIFNIAIGNGTGEIKFSVANDAMGYSGVVKRENLPVQDWREITVKLDKLDNLISNKENVAFIKLDLEGGEFNALLGAKQILLSSAPFFVFENSLKEASIQYAYSDLDFFAYMNDINYQVFDFFGNEVNSDYWNEDLQTYMFCGIPRDEINNRYMDFIQNCVKQVLVNNQL